MSKDTIDTLRIKTQQAEDAAASYQVYVDDATQNGVNAEEFVARFEDFLPLLNTFRDIQSRIEILDAGELANTTLRREFEAKYFKLVLASKVRKKY